jgi:hypothetical protein
MEVQTGSAEFGEYGGRGDVIEVRANTRGEKFTKRLSGNKVFRKQSLPSNSRQT